MAAGLEEKKSESFLNRGESQWGCSSVGRAPALQAGGHEFESHHLHASNEQCILIKSAGASSLLVRLNEFLILYGASRDEISPTDL